MVPSHQAALTKFITSAAQLSSILLPSSTICKKLKKLLFAILGILVSFNLRYALWPLPGLHSIPGLPGRNHLKSSIAERTAIWIIVAIPGLETLSHSIPTMAAASSSDEETTSHISIKDYDSQKDDFEKWVKRFENAVTLSTRDREEASLHQRFKDWLPLKLDEEASIHLDQLDIRGTSWPELKTQLGDLLIDPHERLRWQARQTTIRWDGKESLHSLANRIKRAVDTFDKRLPAECKQQEYFTRFRSAFKRTQKRVIDMNCPEGLQTIEAAKDAVMRYQLANADDGEDDAIYNASFAGRHPSTDGSASMRKSMETIAFEMASIARSLQSLEVRFDRFEQRLCAIEEHLQNRGSDEEANILSRRSPTREEDHSPEGSGDEDSDSSQPRRSCTRGDDESSSENSSASEETFQLASEICRQD